MYCEAKITQISSRKIRVSLLWSEFDIFNAFFECFISMRPVLRDFRVLNATFFALYLVIN